MFRRPPRWKWTEVQVIGPRTGRHVDRFLYAAKKKINKCNSNIDDPLWLLIYRVGSHLDEGEHERLGQILSMQQTFKKVYVLLLSGFPDFSSPLPVARKAGTVFQVWPLRHDRATTEIALSPAGSTVLEASTVTRWSGPDDTWRYPASPLIRK
jgi:hypothetical protein